jgi:Rod binding domain-containing protein
MSSGISPVAGQRVAGQVAVTQAAARDPRAEKLRTAATEFESVLVKQLLKSARLGGSGDDEKTSGYGDMAVDALASAVESGGGLGLARRIEEAVGHVPARAGSAAPPRSPGAASVPVPIPSHTAPHGASGPHDGGRG